MKRFFKVLAWIVLIVVVVMTAIVLYWDRPKEIDFAAIMPEELEYCGMKIGREAAEYIQLKDWFEAHQKGWKNTPASYAPTKTYASPKFSVNVLVDGVVVNYETESGSWSQVINSKESNDLLAECQRANKRLWRQAP
jgi:hypothetical protein